NQADTLIYTTEKSLKEIGDKISAEERGNVESALNQLKSVKDGSDAAALKAALDSLTQSSHKLAEAMYAKASAESQAEQGGETGESGAEDEVVDADFEEVNDENK
ncbi:MAG: Hsp70 family protein, partial [Deltaproteobacteria bacterium]|nr:Hsp70 family protein [Deltaproteobacteria bacterium]